MVKYELKDKFVGKVVHDSRGRHILTKDMSQKALKELYITGHTEKIDCIEITEAKKPNSSGSKSSTKSRK